MSHLPGITLVTPSFNQAPFLEQTIQSVLGQRYDNLQYGVVDGGSTDGSREIIERYRKYLDFVIIEPDRGQTDALNKGMRKASGDLVGWLCSDDTLLPGALRRVGETAAAHKDRCWFAGGCVMTDVTGHPLKTIQSTSGLTLRDVLLRDPNHPFELPQPAVFWRRPLNDELGWLDESLHYTMDFEFWLRLLSRGHSPMVIDAALATYRLHDTSKTCQAPYQFICEHVIVEGRYARHLGWADRLRMVRRLGYMRRAVAARNPQVSLTREVVRRPWWLLSQQVREALFAKRIVV